MNHSFPFDPTYGYTMEGLLKVVPPTNEPADFAPFWEQTYQYTRGTPLRLAKRWVSSPIPNVETYEIEYDSLDGFRVGAWLTVPLIDEVTRGVVVGHGYGGRSAPDAMLARLPGTACVFPCGRGFGRSATPELPGDSSAHVVHGIKSKRTYLHRGCVADLWASATALLELFPEVEQTLDYMGGSFGGGMGAIALPWDKRFRRAYLDVPSFGHHPLRLTMQCVGSGEAVRKYYAQHPEVTEVLAYFDAAIHATHIQTPTIVAAAVFDPAVPPPGQFAVYNSLKCQKELFVRTAAHFDNPNGSEEEPRLQAALSKWFAPASGK